VDEILARISSTNSVAWYLTDRLGSVRDVVNATGTVLDHIVYDSFGNIVTETNAANGDRFKYAGREYDASTGLYYYRARYNDPTSGRFISQDPSGFSAGDANLYRYTGNSPTNATDPTGLDESAPTPAGAFWSSLWQGQINLWIGMYKFGHDLLTMPIDYAANIWGTYNPYFQWSNLSYYASSTEQALQEGASASALQAELYKNLVSFGYYGYMQAWSRYNQTGDPTEWQQYSGSLLAGTLLAYAAAKGAMAAEADNCFAAGTPILTPTGSKAIEQLRAGDWILAAPEEDSEACPAARQVEATFSNHAPLLKLRIGGQTIRTTTGHPLWVRGRGWTPANQLIPGDNLRTHDGRWVVVDSVKDEQEEARVYNVRVSDYHTYFVGCEDWGFSVWAHNASVPPGDSEVGFQSYDEAASQAARATGRGIGAAPQQAEPGTSEQSGTYYSPNRAQPEPWKAYYDQYGRQIGRTDYTNQPDPQTHPNPHYHTYDYGPGYGPKGYEQGPFPGEYPGATEE